MWKKILSEVSFEIGYYQIFNNFCHPNNWSKLVVYCLKFILKLLEKYITGARLHKKARNTKVIKSIQYRVRINVSHFAICDTFNDTHRQNCVLLNSVQ